MTFRRISESSGVNEKREDVSKVLSMMESYMFDAMFEKLDVTTPEMAEILGVSKLYVSKMIQ